MDSLGIEERPPSLSQASLQLKDPSDGKEMYFKSALINNGH